MWEREKTTCLRLEGKISSVQAGGANHTTGGSRDAINLSVGKARADGEAGANVERKERGRGGTWRRLGNHMQPASRIIHTRALEEPDST